MSKPLVRSSRARYSHSSSILPEGVREDFSRFFARLKGLLVILAAFGFALSVLTYHPEDPSWNTATRPGAEVRNLLGPVGSYTADVVLQFFGSAGLLLSCIMIAWGWLVAVRRTPSLFYWRALAALCSVLFLSASLFALFPEINSTHVASLLSGGVFGKLIARPFLALMPPVWGNYVMAFIAFCLSLGALYMASALTIDEWQGFFAFLHRTALATIEKLRSFFRQMLNFAQHDKDDEFEEDARPQRKPAEDEEEEFEEEDEEKSEEEEPEEEAPPRKKAEKKPVEKSKKPIVQRPKTAKQSSLALHSGEHPLPPIDLLQWPEKAKQTAEDFSEEALERNAKLLESVLADFGVNGTITKVSPGPVVTLYELEPSPGTRAARVISLADDIARNMSAVSVRVATVPGRNAIGIEMPNHKREMVFLRELLESDVYINNKATLPIVLGKDIAGSGVIADLSRMPHLLIAGTTGSGKSVAINTMILSLIYHLPPQKCRFIMVDPKMLELSVYDGIPHLLAPVVTEPKKAVMALKWTVREMEERYRAMSKLGVRNIEGYNIRLRAAAKNGESLTRTVQTGFDRETGKPTYEEQPLDLTELPYIVVIVDEMADLMLVAGKDIEGAVQRLAQMARAAGIHLLMATQRPSVDVITGTIKANFPTRVSFQVTSKIDSRTILGEQGAEQLLGQGDMLYMAGGGRVTRVHGPFVRDDEVEAIVKFLKSQGEPEYLEEITEEEEGGFGGDEGGGFGGGGNSGDDLYDKAVDIVLRERKASTSFIQRCLQIGYNRAATLIERMEREGLISEANHVGKREVLGRKMENDE
jgi:S-DNA-T family DNA segregation ATPase FtsK/SpoIIIE